MKSMVLGIVVATLWIFDPAAAGASVNMQGWSGHLTDLVFLTVIKWPNQSWDLMQAHECQGISQRAKTPFLCPLFGFHSLGKGAPREPEIYAVARQWPKAGLCCSFPCFLTTGDSCSYHSFM